MEIVIRKSHPAYRKAGSPLSFDKLRMVSFVEPFAKEGLFLPLKGGGFGGYFLANVFDIWEIFD